MLSRFKPKFWKDINKVKKDRQIMSALYKIFMNIEKAENIDGINNIKQLEKYDSRFRIKLSLDKKRDYRLGLYIHGRTVWFARFLHRKNIYEKNW